MLTPHLAVSTTSPLLLVLVIEREPIKFLLHSREYRFILAISRSSANSNVNPNQDLFTIMCRFAIIVGNAQMETSWRQFKVNTVFC